MAQPKRVEVGRAGSFGASVGLSLEESIVSSLVESSASLLPTGGYFVGRGTVFLAKAGLDVNFPLGRVEA